MENGGNENISGTHPLEKPPVSERKREANRQNAQKSTGPKTDAGKERSSRNAIKHAMWSQRRVQLFGESEQDFLQRYAALREYYQPVGPVEEFEVERIAQMQRRMERASRFENGSICLLQLDVVRYKDRLHQQVVEACKGVREIFEKANLKAMDSDDRETSLPPSDVALSKIAEKEQTAECNQDEEPVSTHETWESFLNHSPELRLEVERASLPKVEDMNIVLRADAAAEKSLARAIMRLEELQAKRKEKENASKVSGWADSDEVITV